MQGYLKTFDPDFVVAMGDGVASKMDGITWGFGALHPSAYGEKSILLSDDILDFNEEWPVKYGTDVSCLYKDLYQKIYQFERVRSREILIPLAPSKLDELLTATIYGEFPKSDDDIPQEKMYKWAFNPTERKLQTHDFLNPLLEPTITPIEMGKEHVIPVQAPGQDPIIFFMNGRKVLDLIDYWNLRATGRMVLPLPSKWAKELRDICKIYIHNNYRAYRFNPDIMHGTTFLCSRSSSVDEAKECFKTIKPPEPGALLLQEQYPMLWGYFESIFKLSTRVEDQEIQCRDGRLSFNIVVPDFAYPINVSGPGWANVIDIREYSATPELAEVIPYDLSNFDNVLNAIGPNRVRTSKEGIVVACYPFSESYSWNLPTPVRVFQEWGKQYGYEINLSPSGLIAAHILRALQGVFGTGVIAHPDILKLLNSMAHGLEEVPTLTKSKARSRTVPVKRWHDLLKDIRGNKEAMENTLSNLLSWQVLRVGLYLQCPHCTQHTWYSLESLSNTLECERCLQSYSFPGDQPTTSAIWHYRAAGPFSIENYAQGSYCVVLTFRFLIWNDRLSSSS